MTALQKFQNWVEQLFGTGASALPVPDVSTLGGVMRNAGGAGQVVSGIASDGSLSFVTLPNGTRIARAQATISGHTSADVPASAPPLLTVYINTAADGTGTLNQNGTGYPFTIANADPMDGSLWIDNSSGVTSLVAAGMAAAFNAYVPSISAYTNVGQQYVYISSLTTGAAATLSYTDSFSSSQTGGGSGTDDVPAGAEQSYLILLGAEEGKVLRPIAVYYESNGLGQNVFIVDDNDGQQLFSSGLPDTAGVVVQALPDFAQMTKWVNGCVGPFYFYFNTPTVGGSAQVLLLAEVVDALPYGTFLYYTCSGYDYIAVYADGAAGTYTVTVESNSGNCGYGS